MTGEQRNVSIEGPATEERTFMITGTDENGDHEIFVTADRARADARLQAMRERLRDVRCNDAFDKRG